MILVVWFSAKKEVSEYLKKQPRSIELPPDRGGQLFMLLYATVKQFWQPLELSVSTHCAIAYTFAPPPTTSLDVATKKPFIFGVIVLSSVNKLSTIALNSVGLDTVRLLHTPELPGRVAKLLKLGTPYLKQKKKRTISKKNL